MPGLVLELQADALNRSVAVADLLRKAIAVSKKLRTPLIEGWLDHELKGYPSANDVPEYRRLNGHLRYQDADGRWLPLTYDGDPKFGEIWSASPMPQPISELEALAIVEGNLIRPYPPKQAEMIRSTLGLPFQPGLEISKAALSAIVDVVRTRVLNWALELESQGVVGEGMTFSSQEREVAGPVTNNYFTNNIGSMTGSQIQQGTTGSTQSMGPDAMALVALVDALSSYSAKQMELSIDAYAALMAELARLRAEATSKAPKASIIRETLASVRHILESAAAHLMVTHGPEIVALLSAFAV